MPDPTHFSVLQRISTLTRWALGFSFIIAVSVPYVLVALLMLPWRGLRIRSGNIYGKLVGPALTRVTGTRARIQNRERLNDQKPAIYVTNHTSELDPFIAMWLCPMGGCGVAKKEIARVPFFGWAYKLSGHLLIDRSNREKAISSMKQIAALVRRFDLSIWIWPEGTRSRDGRLQPLKKGFVHLAIATGLPIVPIVMHDAHKRWPGRSLRMYPGQLNIDVLPAVETTNWSAQTMDEHLAQIHGIFAEALEPHQQPASENTVPERKRSMG
jgi:1-acyl-sn-glycerol-3-phosphate acyltransferase